MQIRTSREVTVVVSLTEREAKMLASLIGALSPADAKEYMKKGINYSRWLKSLDTDEVNAFTGDLYEGLSKEL